jgi:Domain of unknown function (DUF4326)
VKIVKVKHGKPQKFETMDGFVYCGRSFGGYSGSPLGNPFLVGKDGVLSQVLSKYRIWLRSKMMFDCVVRRVMEELTDNSVLGCWCVDKEVAGSGEPECHCDIIAQVWKEYLGNA